MEDPYVMVEILKNVGWRDLNAVSLVCKFWYSLSRDNVVRAAIARREGRLRNIGLFGVLKPEVRLIQPRIRQIVEWKDLLAIAFCQSTIKVVWNHHKNAKKVNEAASMEVDDTDEKQEGGKGSEDNSLAVIASVTVSPIDGEGVMDHLLVWTPIELGELDSYLVSCTDRGYLRVWKLEESESLLSPGYALKCIKQMKIATPVLQLCTWNGYLCTIENERNSEGSRQWSLSDGGSKFLPCEGPCTGVIPWQGGLCLSGKGGLFLWQDDTCKRLHHESCSRPVVIGERWLCCEAPKYRPRILVFDAMQDMKCIGSLHLHSQLRVVQPLPPNRLITIEEENLVKVWDMTCIGDGALLYEFEHTGKLITATLLSGNFIYIGRDTGELNIWTY